jgi:hypothetical protein
VQGRTGSPLGRLPPHLEHVVATVLRRLALTLFVATVFAGMVAAPLVTTLVGGPVGAVLLVCLMLSVYRSLTERWPSSRAVRATAATGWGLPLYFAGAEALGVVGDAITSILILVSAVLVVHHLWQDEAAGT